MNAGTVIDTSPSTDEATKTNSKILRENSLVEPVVRNPFVHKLVLTKYDKIKVKLRILNRRENTQQNITCLYVVVCFSLEDWHKRNSIGAYSVHIHMQFNLDCDRHCLCCHAWSIQKIFKGEAVVGLEKKAARRTTFLRTRHCFLLRFPSHPQDWHARNSRSSYHFCCRLVSMALRFQIIL